MSRRAGMRTTALLALGGAVASPSALAVVSCSTTANGVVFGIYSPLNAVPLNSSGLVSITCTLLSGAATTVNMTVALSAGSSGSLAARTMLNGAQALTYNLYWSTAYAQVWGDGTGGSFYGVASLRLTPTTPTQAVSGVTYGQVVALQDVGAGSYADTIVVTVNY